MGAALDKQVAWDAMELDSDDIEHMLLTIAVLEDAEHALRRLAQDPDPVALVEGAAPQQ